MMPKIKSLAFLLLVLAAFLYGQAKNKLPAESRGGSGEEIEQIKLKPSIDEQARFYTKLIERIGPVAAQEALLRSGLPFTGETHLLNHTVGSWLYGHYGAAGLSYCREYFLASCYHGFLINAIAKGGTTELKKIMQECEKGGAPIVVQCSHAIGHGFLASSGYKNLPEALTSCDQAAAAISGFPVYNCHDGVFMENVWGVHLGQPSPDRWLKETDLIYPCNEPKIPERYLLACWSNQPAWIYQKTNGGFEKIGGICLGINREDHRKSCFNGLARQIHPLTEGKVGNTFRLCSLLPPDWFDYCVTTNAVAAFSVGDRELPFVLCAQMETSGKDACYQELFGSMRTYAKNPREYEEFCKKILEAEWRKRCD